MRATLASLTFLVSVLFVLLLPRVAHADIARFAAILGNDRGDAADAPLRYAGADAERVRDVLEDLGGFAPGNVILLRDRDAAVARRTLIDLNDRIRARASQPDTQVVLLVFFSGHADATALHLGDTRLELTELEQLVRGSAAQFRVLVVDACRSGTVTRSKGGSPGAGFAVSFGERLDGQGVVFLTSSAANEDAQESDELKGSFFTHFFVSGLLGAADFDGDGRVQLDEAYRYAYDGTLRASSRTWAGTQHPSYRFELGGQGSIPLTELAHGPSRAVLTFPQDRSYLVFRGGPGGAVVGEISRDTTARRLFVRPDRYFVRGRAKDHVLEGEVTLASGETRVVEDGSLHRVEYARLVRKGGSELREVHGPVAGYTFHTGLATSNALCHGAYAGYEVTFASLSLTPRLDACTSDSEAGAVAIHANEYGGEVRLAHAWDLPVVTVDLGLAAGASFLHEHFEAAGRAPPRDSVAPRTAVSVGVDASLRWGFRAMVEGAAESYVYELESSTTRRTSLHADVVLRGRIGLGKQW